MSDTFGHFSVMCQLSCVKQRVCDKKDVLIVVHVVHKTVIYTKVG